MEIQKIQILLNQVSSIGRQYEKVAAITGENFNIFNILGLDTNEVRTHTAFIAELLNPKGSHGQGEVFLALFCQLNNIELFDVKTAVIYKERSIGIISMDFATGGNLDIIITDKNRNVIIIENKIYAKDGRNQLLRYHDYAKKFKTYSLFYLTLDGQPASKQSSGNLKLGSDYRLISYSKDILAWLEPCKEKAVNYPILRETITQYIYLIKNLTHQTRSKDMSEELVLLIAKDLDYFNSIEDLSSAYNTLRSNIERRFWEVFNQKISNYPIITLGELDFFYTVDEDGGFHFGFYVNKGTYRLRGDSVELRKYVEILKEVNPEFKENPSFIGWIYPRDIERNIFKNGNKKLVFDLNNEAFLNNFIDKLLIELHMYVDQFKTKMKLIQTSDTLGGL